MGDCFISDNRGFFVDHTVMCAVRISSECGKHTVVC